MIDSEVADWRIYRSDIYGYYFRFPSNWFFTDVEAINFSGEKIEANSIGKVVHTIQVGPSYLGRGPGIEQDIIHFIIDEQDINKAMQDIVRLYSDDDVDRNKIIEAAKPVQIGGLEGLQLEYRATQNTDRMSVNGKTRWAFVVRDNQTYVFGTFPNSNIHTYNESWWQTWKGFDHFLSSIIFVEPQNFDNHIPQNAKLINTDAIDLNGDNISEFLIEYSIQEFDGNGGGQSKRYLKILQFNDGTWEMLKEDVVSYGIGANYDKLPKSSDFEKIKHIPANASTNKEILFVMKKFVEKEKPYQEQNQYKYYIFGLQNNGEYDDFPIAKGYLRPEEYLSKEEINSSCKLYLTQKTSVNQDEGILEYYSVYCGGREPHRTFVLNQKYVNGKYNPTIEKSKKTKEGYFITNDYLWHDSKKLLDENITDLIPGHEDYNVQHTLEHNGKIYLYLSGSSGCGGCVSFSPNYFIINIDNDSVTIGKFANAEKSYLFTRGVIYSKTLFSPDGKKIAYIKVDGDYDENAIRTESVWIFDLISGKKEKIKNISSDQSVVTCEEPFFECHINTNAIFWDKNSGQIIIEPLQYNLLERLENSQEMENLCTDTDTCKKIKIFVPKKEDAYWEKTNGYIIFDTERNKIIEDNLQEDRSTGNFVIHPLDFNNDSVDEYVLYYNDWGGPHVGMQHDILKVYRWDNSKWVTDYEITKGYLNATDDYATHISKNTFFQNIDIGIDGKWEAFITMDVEYNGTHSSYEYVLLKWDGEKVLPIFYPKNEVLEKAKNFLGDEETLGEIYFDPRLQGRAEIYSGHYNAEYNYVSQENLVGHITFKLELKNNVFFANSYKRENVVNKN